MALLTLEQLSVSIHDTPVLHNLNIDIEAGEVLGVIGESGSGKSMTALAIMGLLPHGAALSGQIKFNGLILNELSEQERAKICGDDISMVFQEPMTALNPVHTIGDQVIECIRLHQNISGKAAAELARETLAQCGLPPDEFPLSRYPHELSGGQRQRVVIAMAVALKPKLLIADEPTTALDVTTQAEILDLLLSLKQTYDMALMLISHDLAVVANMASKVVIMKEGHVVEQGPIEPLFRELSHPYTRALFKASDHVPDRKNMPSIQPSESIQGTDTHDDVSKDDTNRTANTSDIKSAGTSGHYSPLLEVSDLICEYPGTRQGWFGRSKKFRAVNEVSFQVHAGESVGLVGESGCGKSTLTRAILGLMNPASGQIAINGRNITQGFEVLRHVQVVFQDPYGSFNPRHKVQRLVSEPLHVLTQKVSSKERKLLVAQMLESVGLHANDADKYIHEFSGGQRQRIAIARALIIRPKLIVLDEAVSALDVSIRAKVLDLLASLANSHGLAYLFISHDLSVVRNVTDRVLVMQAGAIVERGNTGDVFNHPAHEYTQRLVASVPRLPDYAHVAEHPL